MGALPALAFLVFIGNACFPVPDSAMVEDRRLGAFTNAVRFEVLASGEVLVVDAGSERVILLAPTGEVLRAAGGFGWGEGSFDGISGVATDGIAIDVADRNNHRIQRFDRRLTPSSVLSTRDTSEPAARFGYPAAIAITPFGDRLILDGENRRLVKFSAAGRFDESFIPARATSRPLVDPVDISVAANGQIAILERGAIRLLDAFGTELRVIQHDWLDSASGLHFTERGGCAVTTRGLLWFDPAGSAISTNSYEEVFWSLRPSELRDVSFLQGEVFFLTPSEIIVCSNRSVH